MATKNGLVESFVINETAIFSDDVPLADDPLADDPLGEDALGEDALGDELPDDESLPQPARASDPMAPNAMMARSAGGRFVLLTMSSPPDLCLDSASPTSVLRYSRIDASDVAPPSVAGDNVVTE